MAHKRGPEKGKETRVFSIRLAERLFKRVRKIEPDHIRSTLEIVCKESEMESKQKLLQGNK
jgi:hypothetical protein